jgi:hypothetical protein
VIFGGLGIVIFLAALIAIMIANAKYNVEMPNEIAVGGCAIGAILFTIGVICYFLEASARSELQRRRKTDPVAKATLDQEEYDNYINQM